MGIKGNVKLRMMLVLCKYAFLTNGLWIRYFSLDVHSFIHLFSYSLIESYHERHSSWC